MKAEEFLLSQNKAFTFLELVCLMIIVGVFIFGALPHLSFEDKKCIYTLRERLAEANQEFLILYTQNLTQSKPLDPYPILSKLTQKQESCFFEYTNHQLIAHIGRERLVFKISPKDFKSKPKIYCSLSHKLCRQFLIKTQKK